MEFRAHTVIMEADEEGCFLRLPDGWWIEPEGSDVVIIPNLQTGAYHVTPVIREDGTPNCKFIFPEDEAL